jgi:hypothetical protein
MSRKDRRGLTGKNVQPAIACMATEINENVDLVLDYFFDSGLCAHVIHENKFIKLVANHIPLHDYIATGVAG